MLAGETQRDTNRRDIAPPTCKPFNKKLENCKQVAFTLPSREYSSVPAPNSRGYSGVPADTGQGTNAAHRTNVPLVLPSLAQPKILIVLESDHITLTPIPDSSCGLFVDCYRLDLTRDPGYCPAFVEEPGIHQKFVIPRFVNILVILGIPVNDCVVPGKDFALKRESICRTWCRKQTAQLFHL